MCGRFTLETTEDFYVRFGIANRLDALTPRYNIAPGTLVPVVVRQSPNRVVLMRWGLIPHWAKDAKAGYKMINARVETLTQRAAFRGLLRAHRCLVPASGFYEWKQEGRGKMPYYIHPKAGVFVAFAGLYDMWTSPEGEEIVTFTIITKDADPVVAAVHSRMPVILAREAEEAWLDPHLTRTEDVLALLAEPPSDELEAYPVSRRVNAARDDDPSLVQRA